MSLASLLYVDYVLLVAIILHQLLFTTPVFPTLPQKIPPIFPVKVTYKTSTKKKAKAKTKKLTYTMKVAKVGVTLSGDSVVAIGSTTKLTNTKKNSSRAKITYTSSDDSIATVAADGTVTGVKAGKATITAKITVGKDSAETTKDVEVKKAILKDATQTEVTKIVATVAGDTKDLKAGDFKVTNTATNATVAVKSATADKKDSSKVTIETFTEMKDAKEYSVVYDGVTVKFTATDGTPSKVGVDTVQIAAGTRTKVQATLTDVNGVVLSRTDLDKNDSSKGKVTSAVTLTKGYQDGSILYLPAVGDTATIKVTYHTGTFGTDGKEAGNIEDTFTVTAVDPSMINYNFAVTISDNIPAWKANSFKANDKIAMGTDKNAYFRITKDDGNEIADENYADYTVESADKTKLIVNNTKLTNSTTAVSVHGVAEGTTYILVKKDDKTVASIPVTVLAKPVATSMDISKTSVNVCTGSAVEENINVTIKDQYGDVMSDSFTPSVNLLAKTNDTVTLGSANIGDSIDSTSDAIGKVTVSPKKVTIKGQYFANNSKDVGSYTLKISAKVGDKTLTRSLAVNVVKNTAKAQSYEVRIDKTDVDTTVGATDTITDVSKQIKISVAKMANGGAMSIANDPIIYTIKNAKGDVVANVGSNVAYTSAGTSKTETVGTVVSCAAVSTDSSAVDAGGYNSATGELTVRPYNVISGKGIIKNLAAGTYTVQAKVKGDDNQLVIVNGSFTIKDTQDSRASFKILDNKFGTSTTVAAGFANPNLVEVYYDGLKQDSTKLNVSDVKGVALSSGNGGAYIKTVKVYVNVSGGSNYVQVTLNVNDQIATCDPSGITE